MLNLCCFSQALKMGATQEGILRSHMIMRDGYRRDSVVFSWLDTEWNQTQSSFDTV
jgi:RimJ/RimL family protein N-acetyltransferase